MPNYDEIRKLFVERIARRLSCYLRENSLDKDEMINLTKELIDLGTQLNIEPNEELRKFADGEMEESLLNEGEILDKIRQYAKKVLLPLVMLGSMTGFANSEQVGFTTSNGWDFYGTSEEGLKCEYSIDFSEEEFDNCGVKVFSSDTAIDDLNISPDLEGSLSMVKLAGYDRMSIYIDNSEGHASLTDATTKEGYEFLTKYIPNLESKVTFEEFEKIFNDAENSEEAERVLSSITPRNLPPDSEEF